MTVKPKTSSIRLHIHFSDYFVVDPHVIDKYGAFDISLVSDLPLFIDPFLLFNSKKSEYKALHDQIIKYLTFLRDKAVDGRINPDLLQSWFMFKEVKETWLGYSLTGNAGHGLGKDFAVALYNSLHSVFTTFGKEEITKGSHLEKLCLIKTGVGRDSISDFATVLIKDYLLQYTEKFAVTNIDPKLRAKLTVGRAHFDYDTSTWASASYDLPSYQGKFVLLTPKDILTKDSAWINRPDLYGQFSQVVESVSNAELRANINQYFQSVLPNQPKVDERHSAVDAVVRKFPQLIDYYIRYKEDHGDEAESVARQRVGDTESLFVRDVRSFSSFLFSTTDFYSIKGNTYDEAHDRVKFLKDFIENKGGHRFFYRNGQQIGREEDVQLMFRLTWRGTPSDVTGEADDGRGPVDYKVSRGSKDKTLVEFKLASNSHLARNLQHQSGIYEKASDAKRTLKVIIYFSESELKRVETILNNLGLSGNKDVILIDARSDNKPSGSKA